MPRTMMAWSSNHPLRLMESSAHRILNVGIGNPLVFEKKSTHLLDAEKIVVFKVSNFPRFNYFTSKIRFSCNHDHEASALHTWGLQCTYIDC